MTLPETNPRDRYVSRLTARREAAARLARIELSISNGRLAVVVAAALLGWLAFRERSLSAWWLAAPAVLFAVLVILHDRVIRERTKLERAAAFYARGLERLDHLWMGKGEQGLRFADEGHLYAGDLDLFGKGSLFELLCAARTLSGEETLAAWLREPAPPGVIRRRQEAVEELRSRLDLREDLAVLGADVRAGVDPGGLAAWGAGPKLVDPAQPRILAFGFAALTVAAVASWAAGATGKLPVLVLFLAETAVAWKLKPAVQAIIAGADGAARDLPLLSEVLGRLEKERFTSVHLASLREALDIEGEPPSARIARLGRLVELLDSRRNQLFAPFAAALLWSTQTALAIEAWRLTSGAAIGRWLAAVGEMEALGSLAAYASENPDDPFPEIAEGPARFEAEGLGHPLIPEAHCVRNDVRLDGDRRVLIVSGSNMSGKSTLLRSAGINAVLAMAGAPVRARRLSLTPVAVGSTIGIHDSLQAGTSRFYAEITRLSRVVDLTKGALPAFFLLDELLNGTNSHDRRIGAGAVVRALARRGAIGLITTHDLALAHIAEEREIRAVNVHFEDHITGGRITFDYVMRPGVVTKSNGLALMKAVGLDVEAGDDGIEQGAGRRAGSEGDAT